VRCFSPHRRLQEKISTNLRAKAPRYGRTQSDKIHVTTYSGVTFRVSDSIQTWTGGLTDAEF
jgi:hypothetical protein